MKRILVRALPALSLAWFAQAHAADKITILVAGMDKQIYLPAKLAEQLGYLRDTGLDVELLSEPAGASAETEMLSGAAQGVIGFYDHTIGLQARGKLVESVVQFSTAPGEAIVVARSAAQAIKSPADFSGKTLGVTGLGSSTNFLTYYLAAKSGVKRSAFTTLPVGASSRFITALRQGKIQAGMTTEPTVSHVVASGAALVLVDLRTPQATAQALGGIYPGACLYMPTAWVNRHKDEVQRLAQAFVKALRYIRTHSAQDIANHLPPEYYAPDKQRYIDALTGSKTSFTDDGVMPPDGPATVLKVLATVDKAVQGKTINLANTYSTEFVRAVK